MTISVHFIVDLPKYHPMERYALPHGFPIVVIEETQQIHEHVLLFQITLRLARGKRYWKLNTTLAEAYDLRDWFDFLAHKTWIDPETQTNKIGKPWDLANEQDYIDYSNTLQYIVSGATKTFLKNSTIARRQNAVTRFYQFASEKGWYKGVFLRTKITKGRTIAIDSQELAHTVSGRIETQRSPHNVPVEYGEPIRPLTALQWQLIRSELGCLPSEGEENPRRSRDRLACELAIATGLRVDEVASLTVTQIFSLDVEWRRLSEDERDTGYIKLLVTKTKRLKPRNVLVPAYLVPEFIAYIERERSEAVAQGRRHAKNKSIAFNDPKAFFVNHANAGINAGHGIAPESLSRAFHNACIDAGIVMSAEKIDEETREPFIVTVAAHHFHDLRHTFSVWKYHAEVRKGNPEPWKEIQILLGHASLKITMDTYLAVVDIEKRRAGAQQYVAKKNMGEI